MNNKNCEFITEISSHGKIDVDESMSKYTTFKTGGKADFLIHPKSKESIAEIIKLTKSFNVPLTVIGGGSNLLIGDNGIRGAVLRIASGEFKCKINLEENGMIYSDASVSKNEFISFAVANGFEGIQFMAGLPGVLGGGIAMNAGTNMGTFSDILNEVEFVDKNGEIKSVNISDEMSSYRKLKIESDAVITAGFFKLPESSSIKKVNDEVFKINNERELKHPLDFPSAGSVFLNPPGEFSWKLIDEAGLKGKKIGGAMVSEKHTNFIINYDNAVSKDIRDLIEYVKEIVFSKFRISLDTEIRMLGEF